MKETIAFSSEGMDAETGFARYRQLYAQGADVERVSVLGQQLGNGLEAVAPLAAEAPGLDEQIAPRPRGLGQRIGPLALGRRVDRRHLVALLEQPLVDVLAEGRL
ncbi:MAG: hypothetical protein ABGY75_10020, partial [Gemmataceae bacterium]